MVFGSAQAWSLTCRDDAAKQEFWSSLALRECPHIGMRRITALLSHFGSAYAAVRHVDAWAEAKVPENCAAAFTRETWRQKAGLEWAAAKTCPCGIVLWTDAAYPAWLRSIADAPPFLYFLGDLSLLHNVAVAVIGMRSCSDEGLKATAHIARGLSHAGVTVVSGMARGIDRAAHLAGLEGPGSSIGVLGAGIDVVYPPANRDLYGLMREKGLLVSEYPPAYGVDAKSFPVRNRIISALSRAVVVVEAAMRSGSLNTASHALEQNRELMAVPGAVSASSAKGCQELIRKGAKPVFCADDVLHELVPLLAEHVRQGMLARDLGRFRFSGAEKRPEFDEGCPLSLALPPNVLPWRAASGAKGASTGAGALKTAAAFPEASTCNEKSVPDSRTLGLSGLEARVYDVVRDGPIHIDDICRALGHNAGQISRIAAMLEIQGVLTRLPGMRYKVP